MFGNKLKEEEVVYLEIISRYSRLKESKWHIASFVSKEWLNSYRANSLAKSVNRHIADGTHASLLSELNTQGMTKSIINHLSVFSGRCLQNQAEIEVFLEGLASDAWVYNKDTKDIVAVYKKNPALVWLRFVELYG